ncbi:hypothetical protein [Ascidiimonas aurantiaca]|uniref:hypothetical protein n=1 Tax=Ascidiimonas aurantiaca TaxID=1685432 RepID=UPI0030EF8F9C
MKAILNGNLYIFTLLFMFIACKSQIKQDTSLNDLKYEELIVKYGEPSTDESFLLDEKTRLYEYQSTLYDLLNDKKPIEVRELKWVKKDIETVVWLIKNNEDWVSVDNIIWNNKKIKM